MWACLTHCQPKARKEADSDPTAVRLSPPSTPGSPNRRRIAPRRLRPRAPEGPSPSRAPHLRRLCEWSAAALVGQYARFLVSSELFLHSSYLVLNICVQFACILIVRILTDVFLIASFLMYATLTVLF